MRIKEEDPLGDAALIKAARKRLLAELDPELRKAESSANRASVVNNVYGGGHGSGGGGLMDQLGGAAQGGSGEDPFDYFVNIQRKDLPDVNPVTGKPAGWEKTVHRYRQEKKKDR